MSQRELNRLQHQLHSLHGERAVLLEESSANRERINQMAARNSVLQAQAEQHPFQLLRQYKNPLQTENRIYQLQDKIASMNYELAFLQQNNRNKSQVLSQMHSKITNLEFALQERTHEKDQLHARLQEAKGKNDLLQRRIAKMSQNIKQINESRQSLLTEKERLAIQLKQIENKYHNVLTDISKGIQSLNQVLSHESVQKSEYSADNKNYEQLLDQQMRELGDRNNELYNLKTFCEGSLVSPGEANLKNTIKNLRSELGRYSDLTKNVIDKLQTAENIIKRYSQAAIQCEQEMASLPVLKEENLQLRRNNQTQLQTIEQLQQNLQKESKRNNEATRLLVEVVKENQIFHSFLYEYYGESSSQYLRQERDRYEERLQERIKHQKWVNVEELVRVNDKLREKLMMM